MKLNPNCVRDALLVCEKFPSLTSSLEWKPLRLNDICQVLNKYSKEEMAYTLYTLTNADYLESHIVESDNGIHDICIFHLTYQGHELLDAVRSDTVWDKILSTIGTMGTVSLPIIQQLGSKFLMDILLKP